MFVLIMFAAVVLLFFGLFLVVDDPSILVAYLPWVVSGLLMATMLIPIHEWTTQGVIHQDTFRGVKYTKVMDIEYDVYRTDSWWSYKWLSDGAIQNVVVKDYVTN